MVEIIVIFIFLLLIFGFYNVGLLLLTCSSYIGNVLGLFSLVIVIPYLMYRIFKYINKLVNKNENNN